MIYPPLHARLFWYHHEPLELLVLLVMIEHCSDGSSCRASISRYAAYCGCSERKVQYVLRALCRRGELTQLSPGNAAKRRPAVYRVNEAAMEENPCFEFSFDREGRRVAKYHTRQENLPGIPQPWDPKIPDEALAPPPGARRAPVHGVHETGAQDAPEGVHGVQGTGAQRAPDPKAFDSRALDSKEFDPTSSSGPDDDVCLERVIRAFEQSPVTSGKAKPSDRSKAYDDDVEIERQALQRFGMALPHGKPRQFLSSEVARVIEAFNSSPVIARRAGNADRDVAMKLLQICSCEEIERGIVLGTARRMGSDNSAPEPVKVSSLAYFAPAIAEARSDPLMTEDYIARCRAAIEREASRRTKKEPRRATA